MTDRSYFNTKNLGLLERYIIPRIQRMKAMIYCFWHPRYWVYVETTAWRGYDFITYVGVVSGHVTTDDLAFHRHYFGHTLMEAFAHEE